MNRTWGERGRTPAHEGSAASALAPAALKLGGAAANAQSALSPANIHNTAVAGTKQAVARK